MRRSQIGRRSNVEVASARSLNKPTVATCNSSFCTNQPINTRNLIRPENDLAAIAYVDRIGVQCRVRPKINRPSILNIVVATPVVAAHQNRSTPRETGRIHQRCAGNTDLIAEQMNRSALAHRPGRGNSCVNEVSAAFRLDQYLAARCTACRGCASGIERDVLRRLEHDLTRGIQPCAVGAHNAFLLDQSSVDARTAPSHDDLAHVYRPRVRRLDFHQHVGCTGVAKAYRVAGRQNHIAVRRIDDSAVLDLRRNEDDAATRRRGNRPAVDKAPCRDGPAGKVQLAGEKILIAHVERGSN